MKFLGVFTVNWFRLFSKVGKNIKKFFDYFLFFVLRHFFVGCFLVFVTSSLLRFLFFGYSSTIKKPCIEQGGISGRVDKNLCITSDMNLLPQSRRILLCRSASLVGVPRPNAYPLRSLAHGAYKHTPELEVPD